MVLVDSPICGPLRSADEIPVVDGTRNREMQNQSIAEHQREHDARDSNRNRFSPGELPSIEEDVYPVGDASLHRSSPGRQEIGGGDSSLFSISQTPTVTAVARKVKICPQNVRGPIQDFDLLVSGRNMHSYQAAL